MGENDDEKARTIPIKSVKDLGHLFGHELERDEMLTLCKETINVGEGREEIDRKLFKEFSAKLTEEAKYDPWNCIKECLIHYQLVSAESVVNLGELR